MGTMTATRYTEILETGLLPIANALHPSEIHLQQDIDPKHCVHYTWNLFAENWWPQLSSATTTESPDLYPIEYVWGSIKEYLRNSYKLKNLEDMKRGIGKHDLQQCALGI